MSPLTKVFVVLLVVLSILFVAGTIVFVNRTEDYKVYVTAGKAEVQRAHTERDEANRDLVAFKAQSASDSQAKDQQLTVAHDDLQHAQENVTKLNGQVAELQSNVAQLTAASASTAEALKLAQGRLATQQDQLGELRTAADKAERQYTDATIRIGDLENKLQVTEKARRFLAEQNTQQAADLERAQKTLHDNNLQPGENRAIVTEPTIAINGTINDKKVIAGVPYATISVGGADQVTKNMQFKVIDREKNQFLGYLTVDTVEPHEASGRLDGPHVEAIQKGNEVRTQL